MFMNFSIDEFVIGLIVVFLVIPLVSAGGVEWNRTYNRSDNDYPRYIISTSDNGYLILGETVSSNRTINGYTDIWLIKTDSEGNVLWNKTLDGPYDESVYYATTTSDEGFLIVASDTDLTWVIKTDSYGIISWNSTFVGFFDTAQQTEDGGSIIGITVTDTNITVIKTDAYGDLSWNRTFDSEVSNEGFRLVEAREGSYDIFIWLYTMIKIDTFGNVSWKKQIERGDNEIGGPIEQTDDGGYIICGWIENSNYDTFIEKIDSSGVILWNEPYEVDLPGYSCLFIIQTNDGGYLTRGSYSYDHEHSHHLWRRTDGEGHLIWNKTNDLGGFATMKNFDNGFSLFSRINLDDVNITYTLDKMDSTGIILGNKTISYGPIEISAISMDSQGDFIILGYRRNPYPDEYDIVLFKVAGNITTTSSSTTTTSIVTTTSTTATSTSSTIIDTTTTSSTSTTLTTTSTTLGNCTIAGDYPPCGEITLSEVITYINEWVIGEASLSDVVALINAWATG
jgi:hypothetical protein